MATSPPRDESASRWRAYALLLALRVYAAVGFLGMIHPDEFFQSQEVMARHVLHPQTDPLHAQLFLPWEYQLPTPNRSVLFPALVAGLPYRVMLWMGVKPTGYLLLVVPRLLLCFASFVIDRILYLIAKKLHFDDPLSVLLCFASSWTTLVFLTRPFSNTCETFVLALCFAVLLLSDPHKRIVNGMFHRQTLLLGSLLAVGFFTRFTFVFFFFPLGVELVRHQDALLLERFAKKRGDHPVSMFKRGAATCFVAVQGLLAFLVCSAGFIIMDTVYFRPELVRSPQGLLQIDRQHLLHAIVVAPLNNFIYNLQYDNLELHGVHPRITHMAVNMPMLFGPLFIRFLTNLVTKNTANGNTKMPKHRQLLGVASVLFPLACISMAPHQEPRFMLPALIPLQIFAASSLLTHRVRAAFWAIFNLSLMVFFGMLHQGGVIPMLLSFSNNGGHESPTLAHVTLPSCQFAPQHKVQQLMGKIPVVFYKTYMPPRFLFAGVHASPAFQVIDLAGGSSSVDELFTTSLQQPTRQVFVVAPASVSITPIVNNAFVSASALVGSCSPHISTEDLALDKPFAMELHLLTLSEAVRRDTQV